MQSNTIPNELPPAYSDKPSQQPVAGPSRQSTFNPTWKLKQEERNSIPLHARRSMEDERRDLPKGWLRKFDENTHHQFFVDTTTEPPRSIWHHPYDDEPYLMSLSEKERLRIKDLHEVPSRADIEAESTDEEDEDAVLRARRSANGGSNKSQSRHAASIHTYQNSQLQDTKDETMGSRIKDKFTGTTHAEREAKRKQRADEEQQGYEFHQAMRKAMAESIRTGNPAYITTDKDGNKLYVEPPDYAKGINSIYPPNDDDTSKNYNPHRQGPYADPKARFFKAPQQPYSRSNSYGYGYGGGYGGYPYGMGYGGLGFGGYGMGMPLMLGGGLGMGMGFGML